MAGMYPDNQQIDIFGDTVEWPGLDASGKFTNGSFSDPLVKPSFIPAETLNLILDNLQAVVQAAGGSPNNTSGSQLLSAIRGLTPNGTVWMYDGEGWEDNKTLPGWYACTAENADKGCPNMVDRFVMGRYPAGAGGTGGSNTLILTTANLPSHTHGIDHAHGSLTTNHATAEHDHAIDHDHPSVTSDNGSAHNVSYNHLTQVMTEFTEANSGGDFGTVTVPNNGWTTLELYTGSNEGHDIAIYFRGQPDSSSVSDHTHTVTTPSMSGRSAAENCSHAHGIDMPAFQGTSGSTGAGAPIDKRPAHYSMIFIKKVA